MENPESFIESLFEKIQAYIKTTIELTKLKLLEKVTGTASSVVATVSVVLVFALFFFVLTIGIALYLGELLGKSYYGFFIVSGFYLVLGILFHFFLHKWIKKPISDLIIKKTLK
ncbi:MAG TPA: hypothetical protein DC042_09420 [Bacteroidales bacterium]|nr:hypothetical protein [Bacteroidales bacterium]